MVRLVGRLINKINKQIDKVMNNKAERSHKIERER